MRAQEEISADRDANVLTVKTYWRSEVGFNVKRG